MIIMVSINMSGSICFHTQSHNLHPLNLVIITSCSLYLVGRKTIYSYHGFQILWVRLNPLRMPYPYTYRPNHLLSSQPPTKRSVNCRIFSDNIFEAIFFNDFFSVQASHGYGHMKILEAHICDCIIFVKSSQQAWWQLNHQCIFQPIGHVSIIPTMQFFTGVSRIAQPKS